MNLLIITIIDVIKDRYSYFRNSNAPFLSRHHCIDNRFDRPYIL